MLLAGTKREGLRTPDARAQRQPANHDHDQSDDEEREIEWNPEAGDEQARRNEDEAKSNREEDEPDRDSGQARRNHGAALSQLAPRKRQLDRQQLPTLTDKVDKQLDGRPHGA